MSCVGKTGKGCPRGSPTSARNLLLHGGAREWGRLALHPHTQSTSQTGSKEPNALLPGLIDLLRKIPVHAFSPESNCFPSQSVRRVPSTITGLGWHLSPGPVPAFPWLPLGHPHFPVEPSHCSGPHLCALPRPRLTLGDSVVSAVSLKCLYRKLLLTN